MVKRMVRVEISINIVLGSIKPLKKVEESHGIYQHNMRLSYLVVLEFGGIMTSKCINQYLDEKGIKKGNKGYIYLAETIESVIYCPNSSLKGIYAKVAGKYNDSAAKVSGCINYCLKEMEITPKIFIHAAVEELAPFFNSSLGDNSINPFDILLLVNKCLSAPSIAYNMRKLNKYHMRTFVHCIHVAILSVDIASQLGVSEDVLEDVCTGALLHDIGKLSVPLNILNKPSNLDDAEFALIRNHPQQSHFIACCAGVCDMAKAICLLHHRYMNKSGYPENVPPEYEVTPHAWAVDIVTICDVFSAIVSPRAYSDSETNENALSELEHMAKAGKVDMGHVEILRELVESDRTILNLSAFTTE